MAEFILVGFAVALFAVAIQGAKLPPEILELATAAHEKCSKETGVPLEMVEKTAQGEFADDMKLKCYFKCIFEEFKLIDGENLNFDAMLPALPSRMHDNFRDVIQECAKTNTGADLCEKSFNFKKCSYKAKPEEYYTV